MYAIIQTGGKQYRVAAGDQIEVESLQAEPGAQVTLGQVLFVANGDEFKTDAKALEGAQVLATVLSRAQGKKVINFDYRNKHRRRTVRGHRQWLTRLQIQEIKLA